MVRGDKAKSVYIISKENKAIADEIMQSMKRGVTGLYSKGLYDKTDNMMLMCVVCNKEIPTLLKIVKSKDKKAFTIVSEVQKVQGEGFSD